MKMLRLPVTPVVLSLLVVVLTGLVWWAGPPVARAASVPNIALIPVSGIVSAQPESVAFSGQAQVSSELELDTSKFATPPHVLLTVDLSKVSGTGSSTGAKYAARSGEIQRRLLVSTDTLEITFPFFRATTTGTSAAQSGVASFALSFDLNTGAITSGTATVAAPNFPN
jgi:hypothetical protein